MGNYRPVSILSIISKVFEKVVYDQIESYLNDKNCNINFNLVFVHVIQQTLVLYI